ncbi:uncharacterized protein STEHIDRAFT_151774 [Stereum hirsutum FP-91666 SS1]|uniref:uncharacterized protein n=1 Tax=Stereum hirsutum (strain FP-91666) TaxID=721885 RepID=UPI000440E9FF|nr:uncharacterized protein STEHIDRAFT_151774 [Stereum hirsutum FP-91666 SS1]EIM92450.1 hypothetical protein STEHIDRAFT_151774 [Stereum hirsutum FP-91666 SS1]
MNDENISSANSNLKRWEELFEEQSAIFRETTSTNVALEAKVDELERELSVWKSAFKNAEEEKKALNKSVVSLERRIDSLKDDNPLLLCLIDGDGNLWAEDLWQLGQLGGRQAALLLTQGITEHADDSRSQLWVTVYCNKAGLMETLVKNRVCSSEQFEGFLHGFNLASPLFSIIDVGNGKEAADTKIKECLRVFTRFPQTVKVYFGGGHDNGYTSTLTSLENEGLLDKVTLLRGYRNLAFELKNLQLPYLEIERLFMTQKLHTNPQKKSTTPHATPSPAPDTGKHRNAPFTPSTSNGHQQSAKYIDPNLPLNKHTPPPCNFFYLAKCHQGTNCHYGHDYIMTTEVSFRYSPGW